MTSIKHEISNRGNFKRVVKYTKHKASISDTCKCGHTKEYHDDTYGCIECKCMWFEPIEVNIEDGKPQ